MRANNVKLTQEVTRNDAMSIMEWMENYEVTRYMNEAANISMEIRNIMNRVNMAILTHLFNRDGSFYIISTGNNQPIGFLKLVHRHQEAEMVIMIGDQMKWGMGIGTESIEQGLNQAFFRWRLPRVIAKINPDNLRSIKAFEKSGFQYVKNLNHSILYSITLNDYIDRMK